MKKQDNLRGRIPLKKDSKITIDNTTFVITDEEEMVSAGSSCLVYHGYADRAFDTHVSSFQNLLHELFQIEHVIIKEFYPASAQAGIERDPVSGMLTVSPETKNSSNYQNSYQQFMRGLELQKNLSTSPLRNIVAKPLMDGAFGDSYYNIVSYSTRKDLRKEMIQSTFENKLLTSIELLLLFEKLHTAGYLMLDIKPDNFLWEDEDTGFLIIDTDSLISMEHVDFHKESLLFSNTKYAAPEIKLLPLFLEEGDYKVIHNFLTPYADMYALAKYMYELFFGVPFTEKNLYDMDQDALLEQFMTHCYQEPDFLPAASEENVRAAGKSLIQILKKVLIDDLLERTLVCYENVRLFANALDEVCSTYYQSMPQEEVPIEEILACLDAAIEALQETL